MNSTPIHPNDLLVEGAYVGDMMDFINDDEYNEMLNYLFVKIKEGIGEQTTLLEDVVKLFQPDDWEHDPNICEQCGDSVSTTTWNI
jgi:hypothetical protein